MGRPTGVVYVGQNFVWVGQTRVWVGHGLPGLIARTASGLNAYLSRHTGLLKALCDCAAIDSLVNWFYVPPDTK